MRLVALHLQFAAWPGVGRVPLVRLYAALRRKNEQELATQVAPLLPDRTGAIALRDTAKPNTLDAPTSSTDCCSDDRQSAGTVLAGSVGLGLRLRTGEMQAGNTQGKVP